MPFGLYRNLAAAANTRSRLIDDTLPPLKVRETVDCETPAAFATSIEVIRFISEFTGKMKFSPTFLCAPYVSALELMGQHYESL